MKGLNAQGFVQRQWFLLQAFLLIVVLVTPACKETKGSGPIAEDTGQSRFQKAVIEFQIDDPDWDKPSPYVSLFNPEPDIRNMRNRDEIVLTAIHLTLVLDYPLNREWEFPVDSKSLNGFTRVELARLISDTYKAVYAEEERTSKVPVVPLDQRIGLINRNKTEGKYGIWGHDLGDLVLHTVEVIRMPNGSLVAYLGIDS